MNNYVSDKWDFKCQIIFCLLKFALIFLMLLIAPCQFELVETSELNAVRSVQK